jgi:hypothetical protein
MNLARAQRRVDRSYWRAIKAVSPCWQRAWLKGFGAAVSARNAIRAVSFVRHPAGNRDLPAGLRQEAHGVLATSGKQSTTTVGNRSRGV